MVQQAQAAVKAFCHVCLHFCSTVVSSVPRLDPDRPLWKTFWDHTELPARRGRAAPGEPQGDRGAAGRGKVLPGAGAGGRVPSSPAGRMPAWGESGYWAAMGGSRRGGYLGWEGASGQSKIFCCSPLGAFSRPGRNGNAWSAGVWSHPEKVILCCPVPGRDERLRSSLRGLLGAWEEQQPGSSAEFPTANRSDLEKRSDISTSAVAEVHSSSTGQSRVGDSARAAPVSTGCRESCCGLWFPLRCSALV